VVDAADEHRGRIALANVDKTSPAVDSDSEDAALALELTERCPFVSH